MNDPASADEDITSGKSLLRRRDFLVLGTAGLLTPLIGDFAWAQAPAGEAAARPLSVGYIAESEVFRDLRRLPRKVRRPLSVATEEATAEASPVVVPATSLFQGDTSLPGRPLRIRIDGLYPPQVLERKLWRTLPLAMDLDVLFPSPDPAFPQPLRFFAWSFRRQPGWNPSPPVSFNFPLDWQALPQFVLRVRTAAGQSLVLRTKFTLDTEPGRPRLRRGVYLFGAMPQAWDRDLRLADLARWAPAELASVLVSMDPVEEEP
jgi:hypothetical protein